MASTHPHPLSTQAPATKLTVRDLILGAALTTLCAFALLVWRDIGFYPDEFALRLSSGRYLADHGIAHGLYPLCQSRVQATPYLFVVPAWILGEADRLLTPLSVRIFPFFAVLFALALMIWVPIRQRAPAASLLALTAVLGVAGSGLVLARPEFIQVILVGCGLAAMQLLHVGNCSRRSRMTMAAAMLIFLLLALYTHLQALLFLPFALFVLHHLLRRDAGSVAAGMLVGGLFVALVYTTWTFQELKCAGHPLIGQYWGTMQFRASDFKDVSPIAWFSTKLERFAASFYYNPSYAVNYLPGFQSKNGALNTAVALLNQGMRAVLIVNLLLPMLLLLGVSGGVLVQIVRRREGALQWIDHVLGRSNAIALGLLTLGMAILFFDDPVQNFYRSFFLNVLASAVLCMFFARVSLGRFRILLSGYGIICLVLLAGSVALNASYFSKAIDEGYIGPSVSHSENWSVMRERMGALAKACHVDRARGRIVIDDLSYEPLKLSPELYAVTYIGLEATVEKTNFATRFNELKPLAYIGRCTSPHPANASYLHVDKELCCYNFAEEAASPAGK